MKVLLIEDYEPLRASLAKGFRDEGLAVDVATDGEEGLWHAQGGTYDVIVLDLMLPKIDGLTVLRRLRAAGSQDPVLILTARDAVADRVEGLDLGADDYLTKPFSFDELLARLRALVRRRYQDRNPAIDIGPLHVDTAAQRVLRDGEEVSLTAREYSLLEFLARRGGEVVSRTDIWDHLYEFDSESTSNVVDVYIGYLRRKLDRPDGDSIIETVRGRGYRLREPQ